MTSNLTSTAAQPPSDLNPYASPPAQARPMSADDLILPVGDQRLFVVMPIKKISIRDLSWMTRNYLEFALAALLFKTLRVSNRPVFGSALLDGRLIEGHQLPPQFQEDLMREKAMAESLGFTNPIYVTVPTVGPMISLDMYMVTPDGRIGFLYSRSIQRNNRVVLDQIHKSFNSRLVGDRVLSTSPRIPQARPPHWQSLERLRTKDSAKLLARHRERLADETWEPIPLHDRFGHVLFQNRRAVEELVKRGIMREATADEIYAIETS